MNVKVSAPYCAQWTFGGIYETRTHLRLQIVEPVPLAQDLYLVIDTTRKVGLEQLEFSLLP